MVGRRGQSDVATESAWGGMSFYFEDSTGPTLGDGVFGGGEGVGTRQVALSVMNPLARPMEPYSDSDSGAYPPPISEELRASLGGMVQAPPIPKALRGAPPPPPPPP